MSGPYSKGCRYLYYYYYYHHPNSSSNAPRESKRLLSPSLSLCAFALRALEKGVRRRRGGRVFLTFSSFLGPSEGGGGGGGGGSSEEASDAQTREGRT